MLTRNEGVGPLNADLPQGLTGFFKRLAQYYAEFLSTDFKNQRLPRRHLQNSDAQGRLVGISLHKYPDFQQQMWQDLAKPIGAGLSFSVRRGAWRSALPKAVVEAITAHIYRVNQKTLSAVISNAMSRLAMVAAQQRSES